MRLVRACGLAVALGGVFAACGGSSGGSGNAPGNTSPSPTPPSTNPCASTAVEAPASGRRELSAEAMAKAEGAVCRHQPYNVLEALWKHQAARDRGGPRPLASTEASVDVGDIAVIQDEGDIMVPVNAFDLKAAGLVFVRNAGGGYDVQRGDATFKSTLGRRITLGDDASASFELPFAASFFGTAFSSAFINSDGNLTFTDADFASTDRSVTRFLTGPPRVALYFADLDPSVGGGVFLNTQSDLFTVTWCNVPGFDDSRKVTAQVVVQRDGQIEFKFADTTTLPDAVVGLSPGRTNTFTATDLSRSATATVSGGTSAVGERFAESADIDLAALGQKFYRTHSDTYDQLVVWSDRRLTTNAFAYETTVANAIRGIGLGVFDVAREFGSSGTLSSIAFMDNVGKYPDDPTALVSGENSTLGLIGHESGHRWLVSLKFLGADGVGSGVWLGRDDVHWSFFMDSDASFVEGNDIENLGGGAFRTVAAVQRYSALDQYAMGLRTEAEVPPVFYVENPTNVSGDRTNSSNPRVGVTFNGTARTVLIQDVVALFGERVPRAAQAPRVHRQAFVYVVSNGATYDPAVVAKIDRYRREWEPFFLRATDNRMRVETRLRP